MNRIDSRIWLWGLWAVVMLGGLVGCADNENPQLEDGRYYVTGTVNLPAGVTAAEVVNSLGSAAITDGAFSLESFNDGSNQERQLAAAISTTGDPLLLGWLGPQANELSARSTAEVLTFFALAAFAAPPEQVALLIELLGESPELDALAAAIIAELVANPEGFSVASPTLQAALESVVRALLQTDLVTTDGLLVNPADEQSGIRLDQVTGVNQITLVNRYRRPAYAYVDRVSTFDDEGNETASPAEIAEFEIPPVRGLEGGVGTINQIVTGLAMTGGSFEGADLAYTERSLAPVSLPNVTGAAKTRYRVAVVGPGLSYGDLASMTNEERAKQTELFRNFVVKDVVLPLVIYILIPASNADEFLNFQYGADTLQDFVNIILVQAPSIFTIAESGDLVGPLGAAKDAILTSNTFRDQLLELVLDRFFDLRTEAGVAAFQRAQGIANGFIAVSGALDTALTAFDLSVVASSFAISERGNLWQVDANDPVVRLSPPSSTINFMSSVRLETTTPDIGDDVPKVYRYSIPSTALGVLRNARGSGASIDSSENFIFFDSEEIEGSVQVTAEVFQIDGSNRIPLGSATADIEVEEDCGFTDEDVQTVLLQLNTLIGQDDFGNDAVMAYWHFIWDLVPGVESYDITFHNGPNNDNVLDGETITISPFAPIGQASRVYQTRETLPGYVLDDFAEYLDLPEDKALYLFNKFIVYGTTPAELEYFNEVVDQVAFELDGVSADLRPLCP